MTPEHDDKDDFEVTQPENKERKTTHSIRFYDKNEESEELFLFTTRDDLVMFTNNRMNRDGGYGDTKIEFGYDKATKLYWLRVHGYNFDELELTEEEYFELTKSLALKHGVNIDKDSKTTIDSWRAFASSPLNVPVVYTNQAIQDPANQPVLSSTN